MLLLVVAAADSCGETPGAVCDWVYDRTGNGKLAAAADWFVGRPFTILVILLVAWLVTRLARRLVRRLTSRIIRSDGLASLTPVNLIPGRTADKTADGAAPSENTAKVGEPRRVARASSIGGVVTSSISVFVWSVAAIMVIGQLGIDLAPLIAGAGIAGIAIGFGAQSLVRDCLAGFFMIVEDQYGIGDVVDLGAASGVVERITLRTTVVRSQDGTLWHVPNGEVRRVGNRSQLWSVALVDVVVPNGAPLDDAKVAVMEAAAATCAEDRFVDSVLEAPRVLGVEDVGADGVSLRLVTKTAPGAQFELQRALREAIKRRLDDFGTGTPTP
ncbi:mechanosensitive ion channel family protein [Desertimonas flava]|uniref:mechanosensitive ion channel family protein n=1 Tax=Desertimonas flava TaxID=2064846 RepID=UPI000E34EC70|nr:mechanosensitive ion channel family protein [Desertimonas flava]